MSKVIFLIAFISLLSFSCKKDISENTPGVSNINIGVAIQLDSYPLMVGYSWKYHTELNIDTEGVHYLNNRFDSYWNVISDTLIHSVHTSKVAQLDSNYNGNKTIGYTYYANKTNGFYGVAYAGNISSILTKNIKLKNNTGLILFGSIENLSKGGDSLFIPDTSLCLMKFPISLGNSWCSHEYGQNANFFRKWVGFERVTTSAGNFDCVKLQLFHDNDLNGIPDNDFPLVYQYFATKGLIKETQQQQITFSDINSGHIITGYSTQTTNLVFVNF